MREKRDAPPPLHGERMADHDAASVDDDLRWRKTDKPPGEDKVGVRPPPPYDDERAGMEARVRLKLARGERLTAEEAEFFARMPEDDEVPPGELWRRDARDDGPQ